MSTSPLLSSELLVKLEKLELVSRKIFRGRMKGERRSPRKGHGVELADFRDYAPGDDLRRVDWNTFARLERLFLKLFLEEEDLHFYALIDASGSMGFGQPSKLRLAIQLAASLGFVGLVRGDRVKIETLGQGTVPIFGQGRETSARKWDCPPSPVVTPVFRGRTSLWRMLDYLETIRPGQNVSLADGVRNFSIRNKGRGIVVLLTDLLDKGGFESALRYLVTHDMDVYVVQVLSAEELDPGVRGDLRLLDCEDGDAAEVTITPAVLAQYKQSVGALVESARQFCARRGIVHLLARNDLPVEQIIGGYLRTRGLVR